MKKRPYIHIFAGIIIVLVGIWYANNQLIVQGVVIPFGWQGQPYMERVCLDTPYTQTGFPLATWRSPPNGLCGSESNAAAAVLNYVIGAFVGVLAGDLIYWLVYRGADSQTRS